MAATSVAEPSASSHNLKAADTAAKLPAERVYDAVMDDLEKRVDAFGTLHGIPTTITTSMHDLLPSNFVTGRKVYGKKMTSTFHSDLNSMRFEGISIAKALLDDICAKLDAGEDKMPGMALHFAFTLALSRGGGIRAELAAACYKSSDVEA